jgi:predicted metal-dependent HD superfamily phosphohydrolase
VTTQARLHESWRRLMRALGAQANSAECIFADLAARYSAPGRHYHTLDHLAAMLALLPDPPPALALAVWFHDAVYDTHAADNEERSGAVADEALRTLSASQEVRDETRRLILLTKRHVTSADDRDGRRLLDADLAILGAPADEYDRYAAAIRREYAWVADEDYRRGRRRVLEQFLSRERLYFTDEMHERRESEARANLRREVAALT